MALVGKISIAVGVTTHAMEAGVNRAKSTLRSFDSAISGTAALLGSLAVAGGATAAFVKMSKEASDLAENVNKVEVMFGDAAQSIEKSAAKMAVAFGVSVNDYLDAAGKLGGLFKGVNFDPSEVARMSDAFVKLAADASSLFNVPFDVALDKLQSGLAGQPRPLREFGVFIDEDGIKLEAFRMGLIKEGEELSAQGKIATRAAIIFNTLQHAQGDLARTSEGPANSMREAWGRFDNLMAVMGKATLPLVSTVLLQVNQSLMALMLTFTEHEPKITAFGKGLVDGVANGSAEMGKLQMAIGGVVDAFQVMGGVWNKLQALLTATINALITPFVYLEKAIAATQRAIGVKQSSELQKSANSMTIAVKQMAEAWDKYDASPWASEGINKNFTKAREEVKKLRADVAAEMTKPFKFPVVGNAVKENMKAEKLPPLPNWKELDEKREHDHKISFAEATTQGSSEAASIILRSKYGEGAGNAANKTAENTGKMATKFDELLALQKELIKRLGIRNVPDLATLDSLAIL